MGFFDQLFKVRHYRRYSHMPFADGRFHMGLIYIIYYSKTATESVNYRYSFHGYPTMPSLDP